VRPTKECTQCDTLSNMFWKDTSKKDGYDTICITCRKDYKQKKYKKDVQNGEGIKYRKSSIKKKYGVTTGVYKSCMGTSNLCEICGHTTNLCYDHDHITMEFRGVLCDTCNRALGLLKDNTDVLRNAINYLEKKYDTKSRD